LKMAPYWRRPHYSLSGSWPKSWNLETCVRVTGYDSCTFGYWSNRRQKSWLAREFPVENVARNCL
jgi:hypothetical protein